MQSEKSQEQYFVDFHRCVICGLRKYSPGAPICEWCEDARVEEILSALLDRVDEFLATNELTNPRTDAALAFVTDFGLLASKHTYFTSLKKVMTLLIERGAVKKMTDAEIIWGPNLLIDAKRVLPLFAKLNLCSFKADDRGNIEIGWPAGSIIKRAHGGLETEPGKNEMASFILGYILLNALRSTLAALSKNHRLGFDEGVACLYPVEYSENGKPVGLRLPKSITAVLSFLLGSWAQGWVEFDEFTLHRFLHGRGLTGRALNEAIALISQTVPGVSSAMLEYSTYSPGGVPVKRFRYSLDVRNLRDNLRSRVRERSLTGS